jgi:hypothetical protein
VIAAALLCGHTYRTHVIVSGAVCFVVGAAFAVWLLKKLLS